MSTFKWMAGVVCLAATVCTAQAAVVLNNSSLGFYNASIGTLLDTNGTNDPFPCANVACGDTTVTFASAPSLSAAAAVLGNWLTTPATPGGSGWSAATQVIPLSWAVNTETAIIYEIHAGLGLSNLVLTLGVDNGIFVWLDGAYQFGARAGGGSSLGEYTVNLGSLTGGTHYLQVLREDHGGGTGYAINLTGDRATVPEPSALALTGLALLALGATRRLKT